MKTEADEVVDTRGLKCPLPVLKCEKRLAQLGPGDAIILLATDPITKVDIPLFCAREGHECALAEEGPVLRFTIRKAAAPRLS